MARDPQTPERPLCWLCFVNHDETRLDEQSRCPFHGLMKDRVLGIVRVDVRMLALFVALVSAACVSPPPTRVASCEIVTATADMLMLIPDCEQAEAALNAVYDEFDGRAQFARTRIDWSDGRTEFGPWVEV